jgi:hypothetical protein
MKLTASATAWAPSSPFFSSDCPPGRPDMAREEQLITAANIRRYLKTNKTLSSSKSN